LDQDEVVSYLEYRKATDPYHVTPDMLRQMIDKIDSNKDGYLTLTESYAWYQQNKDQLGQLSSQNKDFVDAMELYVTPDQTINGLMYERSQVKAQWDDNKLPLKDTIPFSDFWNIID
jgi:hypothetical protein